MTSAQARRLMRNAIVRNDATGELGTVRDMTADTDQNFGLRIDWEKSGLKFSRFDDFVNISDYDTKPKKGLFHD